MTDNSNELFPVVDTLGRVVGQVSRGHAHDGSMILHPVVHLHLFNSRGMLYLQRRPLWKDIQPGKWDTACGGHVDYGESVDDALRREVSEELGVTDYTPRPLAHYVFESRREREFVWAFATVYDGPVRPSEAELDGGRFWTRQEIEDSMGKGILTPNFENEYRRLLARSKLFTPAQEHGDRPAGRSSCQENSEKTVP